MKLEKENIKSLYEENEDFHEYVEKYRSRDGLTVDEALKCAIVWEYAMYIIVNSNR